MSKPQEDEMTAACGAGAASTTYSVGDSVVLLRPWYRRGRVHTVSSIDGKYATVRLDCTFLGVSLEDLLPAEGAELLTTPYELTDDQIRAEMERARTAKDKWLVDICTRALTPDGQSVVPMWWFAREEIAGVINTRIRYRGVA